MEEHHLDLRRPEPTAQLHRRWADNQLHLRPQRQPPEQSRQRGHRLYLRHAGPPDPGERRRQRRLHRRLRRPHPPAEQDRGHCNVAVDRRFNGRPQPDRRDAQFVGVGAADARSD